MILMTDDTDIKVLPDHLINTIAAGEVIERPWNVVKELVENALDANAKTIKVSLKQGGKQEVRIEDDGKGIPDITKAIQRHSTSKIREKKDLSQIATLGFRGEALASICAVAKVEIMSKTENMTAGVKTEVENSTITKTSTVPMETGTIVIVKELFHNTQPRKKFLKSDTVERRHCQDIVVRLSLCNKETDIRLISDDKELLHTTPQQDLKQRAASVYDVKTAKSMIEIHYEEELFTIRGLISIPYHTRKDKSRQTIMINHRPVHSPAIRQAVYDAYQSLLFLEQHPIFIISIELVPESVDVNVHPTKQEVRLLHEKQIEQGIFKACTEALEKNNLTPEVTPSRYKQGSETKAATPVQTAYCRSIPYADGRIQEE